MSRPSLRRTPKLESLEVRQVLSTVPVGPTPDEQFALTLINLVRTDPGKAATMITSDITPDVKATLDQYGLTVGGLISELDAATAQPPVAWNAALAASAQSQSRYEASNGVQTHQGPGESNMNDRIASAGYSNDASYGENTYAYAKSIDEAMQSFLFDWGVADHGHYNNLLQPGTSAQGAYKDVGIGLVNTSGGNGVGPLVITQDFGSQRNEGPQVLGVVYDDPNNTGFYAQGEGQAGVSIDVENVATGQDYQTQTMGAGGYQLPVAANADYQVTASEGGQVISSRRVHVGGVNVEADFVNNPATNQPAQPVSIPTPAPAPAPTPAPTPVPVQAPTQITANVATSQAPPVSQPQQAQSYTQAPAQVPAQQDQVFSQDQFTVTQASNSSADATTLDVSRWAHWTAKRSN